VTAHGHAVLEVRVLTVARPANATVPPQVSERPQLGLREVEVEVEAELAAATAEVVATAAAAVAMVLDWAVEEQGE